MSDSPERLLDSLDENLRLVARDAEVLRPTELVLKSQEMAQAATTLDRLINNPDTFGILALTIGRRAIEAIVFQRRPYDQTTTTHHIAEPGEVHELRNKYVVRTDPFSKITEPVYGHLRYFNLAAMGQTITDGGSLDLRDPETDA